MNVLLITFSFPPIGGVGVLRALSLAKYLPENGLQVDVLTARNAPTVGKDFSLLEQVPSAVRVHHTWTLDLPFALRKGVKKFLTRGRAQAATPASSTVVGPKSENPFKRLVGNLLLPDPQVGWLPFAFRAAKKIIRQRKIDVVLITVPPFSATLLVSRLRRVFPSLPIVLDFRDEWLSTTIDLVSFNNNSRARAVAHKAEADSVRDATFIVAATEAARVEIASRYPAEPQGKFHCIPNGYDTTLQYSQDESPTGNVVLTYIGSVYGSTDPANFIEAVLALPAELRSRLRVRYIGHIETPAYRESLLRLGDTLELRGFVPQAEALQAIAETTYLLLITHDRINVAAKLYDYLGSGKPIVAAVNPGGDVRRLLDETRAGYWADSSSVEEIGILLRSILAEAPPPLDRNKEAIAGYHRRPLAARYADLLRMSIAASFSASHNA